jgi:transcriptional regulator with XRE-family HTH domain
MQKSLYGPGHAAFLRLLREVREKAGLRQEDVAKRLGKPQSFVSKVESGERRLDVLELHEICGVMGVKFPDFAKQLDHRLARK